MGDSGPEEAVKGVVEDVKGKAKEVIGIVTDRDGLREEGRAQQDKAEAQRDVAKKEAEAEENDPENFPEVPLSTPPFEAKSAEAAPASNDTVAAEPAEPRAVVVPPPNEIAKDAAEEPAT